MDNQFIIHNFPRQVLLILRNIICIFRHQNVTFPFGIVGIETAFPVMYTRLVKTGVITLKKLVDLLAVRPRERFGIEPDGFSVWRLEESFTVDPGKFLSMGHATPFEGEELLAVNYLTVKGGKIVYKK